MNPNRPSGLKIRLRIPPGFRFNQQPRLCAHHSCSSPVKPGSRWKLCDSCRARYRQYQRQRLGTKRPRLDTSEDAEMLGDDQVRLLLVAHCTDTQSLLATSRLCLPNLVQTLASVASNIAIDRCLQRVFIIGNYAPSVAPVRVHRTNALVRSGYYGRVRARQKRKSGEMAV